MAFAPQRPVYSVSELLSDLKHPHFVGLCGDGSNVNDASGQLDQEQHGAKDVVGRVLEIATAARAQAAARMGTACLPGC